MGRAETATRPPHTLGSPKMRKPDTSRDFKLLLWGADGQRAKWEVIFRPMPRENGRTVYGRYDLDTQIITINSRLRDPEIVFSTIMHEATHVALGVVASEWAVQAVEENFCNIASKMWNQHQ